MLLNFAMRKEKKKMEKNNNKVIERFANTTKDAKSIESILSIQNNINIYGNSKVIAISSPTDKSLYSVLMSKTISEVYSIECEKVLLIDCDFYNAYLFDIINKNLNNDRISINSFILENKEITNCICNFKDNMDVVFCEKEIYPTKIFASKSFGQFIQDNLKRYTHIIINMPSLAAHQDVLLIKDVITAIALVAKKDFTKKCDLFNSINLIKDYNLPYVGTIYLK